MKKQKNRINLIGALIIDEVLSVEGLGLVSRLTEDVGGMTFVGLWLCTDKLKNLNKEAKKNGEEL